MGRITQQAALFLVCLTAAHGQEAKKSQTVDTLDEAVVSGEPERQRPAPLARNLGSPNTVTVLRNGTARVRLQPRYPQREIVFRRQSAARRPADDLHESMRLQRDRLTVDGGTQITDARVELAPNIDEADGLPALIPFGPRVSLVNISYARLANTDRPTIIRVNNVIDPETRRCVAQLGLDNDGDDEGNRFLLLADTSGDCRRAVGSREGDLLFADDVPEGLRRALREIYEPIYTMFARTLGSEPGIMFVAWRPDAAGNDFRFERSLNRTNLLLFNGAAWQRGFIPQQQNELWEAFALEQILRRLQLYESNAFTQSAVYYLLTLATAERETATPRRLAALLPVWIGNCARHLKYRAATRASRDAVSDYDCGCLLQFVYDAVARAESRGEVTVYSTWRGLLTASYRRGEAGVQAAAFVATSGEAHRIAQGLLGGAMDWAMFSAELARLGVELRMKADEPVPIAEVLDLTHFRGDVASQ